MSDTATQIETTEPPADVIQVPVDQPAPSEPPTQQTTPPSGINQELLKDPAVQAAIEQARREEKDKLYGRIESQDERLRRIEQERQDEVQRQEEARLAAEAEAQRLAEEEMSVRELFQKERQEWESRFNSLRQEQEAERAFFEKERTFHQLQEYRRQRIEQEADNLMPELLDLVTGNTEEEVENSIALVRAKTDAILEQMRAATPPAATPQRGASITSPPVGPMDNESAYQTLTAEDIAAMDMNTYAQYRDKIHAGLAERNRNRGLYG